MSRRVRRARRARRGAAALLAIGVAACSTADAGSEGPPPESVTAPMRPSTPDVQTGATGDDTAEPSGESAEGAPAASVLGGNASFPTSTLPTAAGAPVAVTVAESAESAGGGVAEDVAGEIAGDEPTFDVEPAAPLDLDLARFDVDDAGIGGGGDGRDDPGTGGPPPTGWAGFDAALSDLLLRNGNTAASVAVSIGGDVVHSAAFGRRTLDGRDPAHPGDRFRVASISKTLTAITLLQLVEDGMVGLDQPVGDIVVGALGITDPASGVGAITVRQLLTHRTGFGKYDDVFFRGRSLGCRHAATIGLRSSLASSPGGSYRYSNMNYCVAGELIEALTGRSYESVVYERLLTPLGLAGLRLAPTFDPGPGEIEHPSTAGRNYMETLGAAGGWLASPEDLVVVLDSLDLSTPGWKPLELDTLIAMQTPPGGVFGQRGYGMGLILYGPGRYGHTGTIENTHAMVMNRGDGVIWAITVSGPYPDDTPRLESIINQAFAAGGFVAG